MKKPVRKNVSVSVLAPAFIVAKLDRLATSCRGRSAVILFLLEQGLIDRSALRVLDEGGAAFPASGANHMPVANEAEGAR